MSAAEVVLWVFLTLFIGWLGYVLWATFDMLREDLRRAGVIRRPGGRD